MLTPSSNLPADSMPISRVSSPRADGYRARTVIRNSSLRSTGVTTAASNSISPAVAQRTSWERRSSQRPLPHSLGFHHRIRRVRPVLSRPSRASGRDSHPKPPPATVIIGSWETIASSMPSVPVGWPGVRQNHERVATIWTKLPKSTGANNRAKSFTPAAAVPVKRIGPRSPPPRAVYPANARHTSRPHFPPQTPPP
mmetsp:Transcript_900/g.1037  ORF Transcript_900/g.1037 Transcript_900/m.1037 type:complete len:197 (-) Transcript_900:533-1123(-)